jgi:Glycosyl hydrolases family 25.
MAVFGVDTSWPQGDYQPGSESFVFVGASSADGGSLFVQFTYAQQVDNARRAGKEVGHYFFNGAVDPVAAANFFAENLHDYRPGDGIALDVESSGSGTIPAWSWGDAEKWVDQVAARLHIPTSAVGIYCDMSTVNRPGGQGLVTRGCWLWIAWPGPESQISTGAWHDWTIWQYGINGVDVDKAKTPLQQLTAGPTSLTPPAAEEEDDNMKSVQMHYTRASDKALVHILFTPGTSWFVEWTETGANIANGFSTVLDTHGSIQSTESMAGAIKAAAGRVQ